MVSGVRLYYGTLTGAVLLLPSRLQLLVTSCSVYTHIYSLLVSYDSIISIRQYTATVRFYTSTRSPCGDLHSCKNPQPGYLDHSNSVSSYFFVRHIGVVVKSYCAACSCVLVNLRVSSHRLCECLVRLETFRLCAHHRASALPQF